MALEATEEMQRISLDESGKKLAIGKFQSSIAIIRELLYETALATEEPVES